MHPAPLGPVDRASRACRGQPRDGLRVRVAVAEAGGRGGPRGRGAGPGRDARAARPRSRRRPGRAASRSCTPRARPWAWQTTGAKRRSDDAREPVQVELEAANVEAQLVGQRELLVRVDVRERRPHLGDAVERVVRADPRRVAQRHVVPERVLEPERAVRPRRLIGLHQGLGDLGLGRQRARLVGRRVRPAAQRRHVAHQHVGAVTGDDERAVDRLAGVGERRVGCGLRGPRE